MSVRPSLFTAFLILMMGAGGCDGDRAQPGGPAMPSAAASSGKPVATPSGGPPAAAPPKAKAEAARAAEMPGYLEVIPPLAPDAPARRYANMSAAQCLAQARARGLPVASTQRRYSGVEAPVRYTAPVNGVAVEVPGRKGPLSVLDCRLALAIEEMTRVLSRFEVTRLEVDNMFRKGARISGKRQPSQHASGLAIDILAMTIDGREAEVEEFWKGRLGSPPCGPQGVLHGGSEVALAMRNAVCEIARRGLFHHMLTPSRNEAHADHLHFDLEAGERSLLLE